MSYRLKITLPEPVLAQLAELAEQQGEPLARVATQVIVAQLATEREPHVHRSAPRHNMPRPDSDRRAPWIEPFMEDRRWRADMWGSIVALTGRYPRALANLKEGWWDDATHVETLCALVVWRDWIDQQADDPRYELAFQAQLADYARALQQAGGAIDRMWKPGPPPDEWAY